VIAVDTGYGQMDGRLRIDPRVRLLEKTNARYMTAVQLWGAETPERIALVAMDVSFISATLVLPSVVASVRRSSSEFEVVVLVKPQFEAGREQVGKGGIVRDAEAQQAAVEKVRSAVEELGGSKIEVTESPILGAEGNREFLLRSRWG
jgi:23S rRNA (cytidine1920-2'-O)/16S rRNA (cytidine1409-2'-O)-methyltransferase